eukprot:2077654-Prymnesium_polylepis.1
MCLVRSRGGTASSLRLVLFGRACNVSRAKAGGGPRNTRPARRLRARSAVRAARACGRPTRGAGDSRHTYDTARAARHTAPTAT